MKPVHSPAPLSTAPPAGSGRVKASSASTSTLTPVRATPRPSGGGGSSRWIVACPRPTPATSRTELVGPVGQGPDHDPQVTRARHGAHPASTERRYVIGSDHASVHADPRGLVAGDAAPRADARGLGRRTDRGHRGPRAGRPDPRGAAPRTTWSRRRPTTTTCSRGSTTRRSSTTSRTIHAEWSDGPYDELVGQDRVVPYVFPTPAMTQGMPPDPGRGHARPGGAVRLRHDDAGRPRHLGGGPGGGRLRPHRGRPGDARRRDRRRTRSAGRPATTRPATGTAAPATSTTPPSRRRRCATPATTGSRSSTSTPTTATARRRSSGTAPTCVYGSLHVDPGAGWFPHFFGHADETGAGDGRGRHPQPAAAPRAPATRRGSTRSRAARRRRGAVPTRWSCRSASTPPPTTRRARCWSPPTATRAAGRLLGVARAARGRRPGGRLPPAHPRRPGGGLPRRTRRRADGSGPRGSVRDADRHARSAPARPARWRGASALALGPAASADRRPGHAVAVATGWPSRTRRPRGDADHRRRPDAATRAASWPTPSAGTSPRHWEPGHPAAGTVRVGFAFVAGPGRQPPGARHLRAARGRPRLLDHRHRRVVRRDVRAAAAAAQPAARRPARHRPVRGPSTARPCRT